MTIWKGWDKAGRGEETLTAPLVFTDPHATVAGSTNLSPSFAMNKKFEIGQTSGEGILMELPGTDGFAVIQPHEESGPHD